MTDISPPVLYRCQPTIDLLALFFKLSDRTFECVLEDSPERAATIYQGCDVVVNEILQRFRRARTRPGLVQLYLEENDGRRTDISAQMATFWENFHAKLELRDWIFRAVNSALLVGAAFKFTGLLNAVYVGLIGVAATLVASALQSLLETKAQKLRWRVG